MSTRIHHSFGYAIEGIVHAFKENRNMRIHVLIAILVLSWGYILELSRIENIIILLTILFVMAAEMINSAIEEMTNLITKEHRREAKIAKDVAAGMVLIASIGAVVVGISIFLPYILKLI